MKYIILLVFCWAFSSYSFSQTVHYSDAVYSETIKTIQTFRKGFNLSAPVMGLNEEMTLVFNFDELSDEPKDYYYTILHCDEDWTESRILQNEYLDGFYENPVEDYKMSFNTTFKYVNYNIELPNDQVSFTKSGNYVLIVYEDGDREKIVFTRRFMIYENTVSIEGLIKRATFDAYKGSNQEVDFKIHYPDMQLLNPSSDIKVVVLQNNRWDNAIRGLKPLYIHDNILDYNYNTKENVFPGGNEFRYFDNRTNQVNAEHVIATNFFDSYYHKTLAFDDVRCNKKYVKDVEMNGRYAIESQDQEVQDYNTECDYTFVHFTLSLQTPLVGGGVYVFGALSNWNVNKSNEMTYNYEENRYELSMLLKQGYYNYMYVYVPAGSKDIDFTNLEGSFWQTENDYQIFVYYSLPSSRYDRLIGYMRFNSEQ
jgi:hypothetical protein